MQNGLKQGDVQENQVVLKLNGPHQLLLYADDVRVNLLGDKMNTINRNTESLADAIRRLV
jgi:nicotinate-nucleotide pyrophosphorylase